MSEREDEMEFANEQLLITEGIHQAKKLSLTLRPYGKCHNCSEDVEGAMVFCDKYCAEDHAKIERANKQRVY